MLYNHVYLLHKSLQPFCSSQSECLFHICNWVASLLKTVSHALAEIEQFLQKKTTTRTQSKTARTVCQLQTLAWILLKKYISDETWSLFISSQSLTGIYVDRNHWVAGWSVTPGSLDCGANYSLNGWT